VQAQVLNLINRLRRETNTALIFISHDLAAVAQTTDYIYVMHRGRVVEQGKTEQVLTRPRTAQTQALIDSIPRDGWVPRHLPDSDTSEDTSAAAT
jgi:peptide/nickel transport system ATP-binding protein